MTDQAQPIPPNDTETTSLLEDQVNELGIAFSAAMAEAGTPFAFLQKAGISNPEVLVPLITKTQIIYNQKSPILILCLGIWLALREKNTITITDQEPS